MTKDRVKCPVCKRKITCRINGKLHTHGPYEARCTGSGLTATPPGVASP